MNRDRNAKANQGAGALQKYHRECALAWMDEVGGSGMGDARLGSGWVGLGLGCLSGGGGSICVEAACGRAGWILRCTEVRNLVYEISVTQFQCARGHDRREPAA